MTPPPDGPGVLVSVLAIVASLAAITFGVYVLGGWRWVGRGLPRVKHCLVLAGVMALSAAVFLLAVWHETERREDAWDRYDEHLERLR